MCKILIFGGTYEGRQLAEFCSRNQINICISVTTNYGAELLPQNKNVKKLIGELDFFQIKNLIAKNNIDLIIDATHPYAELATKNIKSACKEFNKKYYRLAREANSMISGEIMENIYDVIDRLNCSEKRILSTLGSKELRQIIKINNYQNRVWIRVLPTDGIVKYCENLGFSKDKIILGKGPFSTLENIEHIKKCNAEILVTKESGETGGYPQKAEAARNCGIELITLKRPHEKGYTIEEIKKIIYKKGVLK
ncbi:MAG: precorrin-6A reductase [Prevotella sp.]|nr:precorrin-6A reductase [Prevotella sp.]